MIIKLKTDFSKTEMKIFKNYIAKHYTAIDVRLFINTDLLYDTGINEGEEYKTKIENPRRIICVGGLYLLETEDELGTWNMGDYNDKGIYHFWGNYGDLKSALEGL